MSDERLDQPQEENEDVEAHSPRVASPRIGSPRIGMNDEPTSPEEGNDEVEAHTKASPRVARPKQA